MNSYKKFSSQIITNPLTKHCKLCQHCYYRLDHHCLYLLRCISRDNHPLFCWLIIFAFLNMVAYCIAFFVYGYILYSELAITNILSKMMNKHAWPFSLFILNAGSSVWSAGLLQYQFEVWFFWSNFKNEKTDIT